MTERQIRARPFVIVGVLVCAVGTAVGVVMGFLSRVLYVPDVIGSFTLRVQSLVEFSAILGGICGLAAGCVWCHCVIRPLYGELQRSPREKRPILGRSVRWGAAVGAAAGVMVHLGLIYATGVWNVITPIIGAICGLIAGALTGIVCCPFVYIAVEATMRHLTWDQTDNVS